ncbi:hypothetical protein GW17_00061854 [Ensete ventricosum]|nr:hypothetical protein GW17_00061854 [Ensete ventricosum]
MTTQREISRKKLDRKPPAKEPLAQFTSRFVVEIRAVPDARPSLVIQAFLMGLQPSKLLWSLAEKSSTMLLEMMQMANHYIAVETLMASKNKKQKCPRAEQSRGSTSGPSRQRVDGPYLHVSRPPPAPLNSTHTEIFLQIREKGLLAPPNPIKTCPEDRDREYNHDTEEYRDLKNQIEDLIRQGHLGRYVRDQRINLERCLDKNHRPRPTEPIEK